MRASVIARQKRASRKQLVKDILTAIIAIPVLFALVWLAYFATI